MKKIVEKFIAALFSWLRYLAMVILSGATLAGFILIFFDLAQYLFTSSDFTVQEVSVTTTEWLDKQEILAFASIAPGSNIWMIDLDRIRRELLKHPVIRDAKVQRVPPRRIHLVIEERVPEAYMLNHDNGRLYGIGSDGVVLPPHLPGSPEEAEHEWRQLLQKPLLSGIDEIAFEPGAQLENKTLQRLLEFTITLSQQAPSFYNELAEVQQRGNGNTALHPRRRIGVVILRESLEVSVAQKLNAFWKVLEEKNLRAVYVDARFPKNGFAVRWDDSSGPEWKRLYQSGESVLTHAMPKGP